MAVTRRERRESNHMSSHQLRSGGHLHTLPTTRPSRRRTCRPRKIRQPRPHPITHSNIVGEKAAPLQEDSQSDQEAPASSSVSDQTTIQPLLLGSVNNNEESPAQDESLTPVHNLSQLQKFPQALEADDVSAATDRLDGNNSPKTLSMTAVRGVAGRRDTQYAENVRVPFDTKRDPVCAHQKRFCFDHWKDEFLVEYAEGWMHPSDFSFRRAEVKLQDRLRDYEATVSISNPRKRASPAECHSSLWSQADTPVQQDIVGGKAIYLIQWKLCWTSIENSSWAESSCKAQEGMIKRRRSARVEETSEARTAKRDKMLVVVRLEDFL